MGMLLKRYADMKRYFVLCCFFEFVSFASLVIFSHNSPLTFVRLCATGPQCCEYKVSERRAAAVKAEKAA